MGAFQLSANAPPLNPTRERVCHTYTQAGDVAVPAAPLPAEIGAVAQYGRPYWGTWMPPFTPREPASVDPYPACMREPGAFAIAQSRFEAEWAAWRAARVPMVPIWLAAPLAGLPFLLLTGLFLNRLGRRKQRPLSVPKAPLSRAHVQPRPHQSMEARAAPALRRSASPLKRT
jgi:hypothetical protein